MRAVLGHELAHFLLFDHWEGQFLTATELLDGLCNDAAAAPAHLETGRLFRLYSEVFADRGALHASQDTTAAISTLIKMETGLIEVSAESYLRQADEIFSKSKASANQLTHPESYIRARALKLWADQGEHAAGEIDKMKADWRARLDAEFEAVQGYKSNRADWLDGRWASIEAAKLSDDPRRGDTGVPIETLKEIGRLPVTDKGEPVTNLNELEYINGEIYANVWQMDRIARISPKTGQVASWIDLRPLREAAWAWGAVAVSWTAVVSSGYR